MRSHGEGSLFMRRSGPGKGQWVALVTMRDGRRASRWAKTRDEAKAELAELLRLRDAGAPLTGRVRLGAFLERWVSDDHGWAPATQRKHVSVVRVHLAPRLGAVRMSELSVADVDRLLGGLDLGPQSARHVRATLRRALADAQRDGLVARNVGALSRAPKLRATERTILDATQARILIESTRTTRYGPLWTILVTTGLRISEALGLMWSSVDFGGNDAGHAARSSAATAEGRGVGARQTARNTTGPSITVRHQLARENGEWVRRAPKTAKGRRTIPLTPLGVEALRAQRAMQREWRFGDGGTVGTGDAREDLGGSDADGLSEDGDHPALDRGVPNRRVLRGGVSAQRLRAGRGPETGMGLPVPIDGLVFTTSTGHPLHETNTLAALHKDLHAAGLPRVTQHDLRHTSATLLYSMGVPLETIADILGHSSSRITADLYRHRVADLQTQAALKMQEALG